MNSTSRLGMRIAHRGLVVPIAALAAVLAGCGSGGDAAPASAGGTLTFAVPSDAGCVDPQQVSSSDTAYALRQTVDSLTDQDPSTGRIVPWLASGWTVSPDAKTFTFRLRSGATFSDGSPVDAKAVKDNFDTIGGLGASAVVTKGFLSGYAGATVLDPHTVQVDFTQPNAQFLQATSTSELGLVADASTHESAQRRCQGVSGSGPFVLSQYVPNQSITLTRREGYDWGSSLWTHPGAARLSRLVFTVIPETAVRVGSLNSGQVDVISGVDRSDEAALRGAGSALLTRATPGVVLNLGLNNSRPILSDLAVRQAIEFAVNRQQVVDTVFPAATPPATGILSHTTPDYLDLASLLAFDPTKAKSLLAGAGWAVGGEGIRVRDGVRLSLTVDWFANSSAYSAALQLIQQQLRSVGIELVLKELQVAEFPQVLESSDFDVLWGGDLSRSDPDGLRTLYDTGLVNTYRLPPTPLDSLLTAQAATLDPTQRASIADEAQRLIVTNAYVVPVVEQTSVFGMSATVHDLTFSASGLPELHDTWKG